MITVLATGGTIASRPSGQGLAYAPAVSGAELVARACEGTRLELATEVVEVAGKTSYMLEQAEIAEIMALARRAIAGGPGAGVVLIMGTAAMEELAFLLDLTLRRTGPVAVTGAMLNASHPGWDGLRNLGDALRLASDAGARGLGTVVVMAGQAHAARDVQKVNRSSIDAFRSDPAGPLALIDADRISYLRAPRPQPVFDVEAPAGPVDVIYATLGGDGRLLRAAVESGARAVVVQGLPGGGGVSPALMREMVAAIEAGLPLVLTSRSPFGRLLPAAGGGSGPADVAAAGGILAGDLNAAKARVLLLCALAAGHGPDQIRADFAAVAP